MQGCDRYRDRLVDFVEGELPAGERRSIEAHLARCAACSRDVGALRETLADLRGLPEPAVPDGHVASFAAAVQRRISAEPPPRLGLRQRAAACLGDWSSVRPIPALSAAAALGLLLAIGLVRTPRTAPFAAVPEVVMVAGETLSIAQNLDVLEHFDLLEDLDILEQLSRSQAPEHGRPVELS